MLRGIRHSSDPDAAHVALFYVVAVFMSMVIAADPEGDCSKVISTACLKRRALRIRAGFTPYASAELTSLFSFDDTGQHGLFGHPAVA
jgi:hypothetical protein